MTSAGYTAHYEHWAGRHLTHTLVSRSAPGATSLAPSLGRRPLGLRWRSGPVDIVPCQGMIVTHLVTAVRRAMRQLVPGVCSGPIAQPGVKR